MKRKAKWAASVIVVLAVALTVYLYIGSHPSRQTAGPAVSGGGNEIRFEAAKESITRSVEVKGKSSYVKETIVYAPFAGEVDSWHIDEGQEIQAGEALFELDGGKLHSELSLAEARILQQQLELKLLDAAAAQASEFAVEANATALERFAKKEQDELLRKLKRLELEIARAELADKQERLDRRATLAPESGIFLFRDAKKPDIVAQDQPVGVIVDLSELQLICEVSEFEVFRIKENMEVEVKIDAWQGEKVKGRVLSVAKFAKSVAGQSAGAALFEVAIGLERHPDLIAGLSLTGKIITDSKPEAVVVPTIAVLREGEQYFVYTDGEHGVEKRAIRIGLETSDKTEVLEGLAAGESVVLR